MKPPAGAIASLAQQQCGAVSAREGSAFRDRHVGGGFLEAGRLDDFPLDPILERLLCDGLDQEAEKSEAVI